MSDQKMDFTLFMNYLIILYISDFQSYKEMTADKIKTSLFPFWACLNNAAVINTFNLKELNFIVNSSDEQI